MSAKPLYPVDTSTGLRSGPGPVQLLEPDPPPLQLSWHARGDMHLACDASGRILGTIRSLWMKGCYAAQLGQRDLGGYIDVEAARSAVEASLRSGDT